MTSGNDTDFIQEANDAELTGNSVQNRTDNVIENISGMIVKNPPSTTTVDDAVVVNDSRLLLRQSFLIALISKIAKDLVATYDQKEEFTDEDDESATCPFDTTSSDPDIAPSVASELFPEKAVNDDFENIENERTVSLDMEEMSDPVRIKGEIKVQPEAEDPSLVLIIDDIDQQPRINSRDNLFGQIAPLSHPPHGLGIGFNPFFSVNSRSNAMAMDEDTIENKLMDSFPAIHHQNNEESVFLNVMSSGGGHVRKSRQAQINYPERNYALDTKSEEGGAEDRRPFRLSYSTLSTGIDLLAVAILLALLYCYVRSNVFNYRTIMIDRVSREVNVVNSKPHTTIFTS